MEFFKHTLPNGIRCIYKRTKSPVTYCSLTINAGSRDEKNKEFGIAHFTEHAIFKGTKNRKAYHINSRLEKLGGELNAFTTKEETVVHATSLKSDFSKAAELIADICFNSVFPEKEIEKEREVVIDEINSYKDSPPDRIYDEFEDLLFSGSELGHNILGTKSTVSRFSGDTVKCFTRRCYNTDNMVFAVSGNLPEKNFRMYAERYFADKEKSTRVFSRQTPEPIEPFRKIVDRHTHQAHCIIGARAYGHNHPKRVALSLLTNMLGGPAANSMLNVLLREKNALTYGIDASYTPYSDTGVAAIYFGTDKDKIERCLPMIETLLKRLKTTLLSSRQLAVAKKQLIGQLSISMESNEGYMLSAAKSYLVYDDVDSPSEIYRKILEVTPSDIMETANEVFSDMSYLIYN